ncbi:hypothetical protein M0804_011773 [Polistes exclamans]|nr:hypothetical protein M0804_011773 [Polistes exclamans]
MLWIEYANVEESKQICISYIRVKPISGFNQDKKIKIFEKIRYYFGNSSESIPMSFVLGFYVSLVVKRWWEQYKLLPWPDNLALFISAAIPGNVNDYLFVGLIFFMSTLSLCCRILDARILEKAKEIK